MKNLDKISFIIGFGVVGMFVGEISNDLNQYAKHAPAIALGVLRAYMIYESSHVKRAFPEKTRFANTWQWLSFFVSALYILGLLIQDEIELPLFFSLQACNIMLIGAELHYSLRSLIAPDRATIETQSKRIEELEEEAKSNRETIEANSSKIEEQRKEIELNSLEIKEHSEEIENYKKRIGSFESEQKADRLKIESQFNQIAQLKKKIETHSLDSELVAELRKGIAGPTGIHWLCECNEPRFIGNKAKDKRLICNKCK